jgi:ketosteroid isomerase-like protein
MDNAAWIQRVLDETFATLDFTSLAAHLADDVVFEVTPPGRAPARRQTGKDAVVAYFTDLGDIVSFWRVRCYGDGERVVALGEERFTMPRYGVTLGGEFAMLLHVCGEYITRFLIIEDLSRSPVLEETALATGR